MNNNNSKNKGSTMIELVIVMAITGILAVGVAMFMRNPMKAYDQTMKRADLTDQAFLLIKKIKQDIRASLPNSVRTSVSGNQIFIEMLTISNGGKYRTQLDSTGSGDVLDFSTTDTSFDILSGAITFSGGEKIVVANVGSTGYDAYAGNNMSNYNGTVGTPVTNIVMASKKFPLAAVNENFYVVDKAVSYVCDKSAKTLTKYWGYTISATQPTNILVPPLSFGSSALLAKDVVDCSFIYSQGANTRNGVVSLMIKLQNAEQSGVLYGDTYVPNT